MSTQLFRGGNSVFMSSLNSYITIIFVDGRREAQKGEVIHSRFLSSETMKMGVTPDPTPQSGPHGSFNYFLYPNSLLYKGHTVST